MQAGLWRDRRAWLLAVVMAALLAFLVILGLQRGFMADPSDWGPLLLLASLVGVALRFSLQRNRTLQQLREREETYRLLAENASDVVFRIDPQGQLE
jgi:PAS domain-containing protein